MRKLLLGPKNVIEETGLLAQKIGLVTSCENVDLITYDVIWSNGVGSLDSALVIQFSHDEETWYDLPFSSTITMTGASGSHRVDIEPNFKFVRPVINFTVGNGDFLLIVKGTTKGA